MSSTTLLGRVAELNTSVLALAAIGAELRLLLEQPGGNAPLRPLLREVAQAVDPQMLGQATPGEMESALGAVRAVLLEALELLDQPDRASGWRHEDPALLRSVGAFSHAVPGRIEAMAATRPDLLAVLRQPGRFLDIGTGSGAIAIAAARLWPQMAVVGIDVWEPSLVLARAAVAATEVAARVEIRRQDMLNLGGTDRFSLIWLPTQFAPGPVITAALPRLHAALAPGGWLVLGVNRIPADPLGGAVARLRVTRNGGQPWLPAELASQMEQCGFLAIETLETASGACNVIGRRS